MTQPRFRVAQPRVIFIRFLYLAQINPVLRISGTDDLEIAGSSPLCTTIFLPTMFACRHTSLQVETHS